MKALAALILLLCPQEKPSEVVFVGTQHFISDSPEGYTPAHLRVLLATGGGEQALHPGLEAAEGHP